MQKVSCYLLGRFFSGKDRLEEIFLIIQNFFIPNFCIRFLKGLLVFHMPFISREIPDRILESCWRESCKKGQIC